MTALILACTGLAAPVLAQKDAAEKAREGGIDHWIDYYRNQRSVTQDGRVPREPPSAPGREAPISEGAPPKGSPSEGSPAQK